LRRIPADANLGLSCGNPTAVSGLKKGETVLDLGSGAGMDSFLAAEKVGPEGRVIGVDMTPEMVERARENAERSGVTNTEFRLGEIENLPVADGSVDVVISNCVINLSTDKARVFREVFRVLKPGGRIAIADIALTRPLPEEVFSSYEAYVGCVAGAVSVDDYRRLVEDSGLKDIRVSVKSGSSCSGPVEGVVSIEVTGCK
ncbi:MAG TPA: arsenite methyltransferase, partial [Nitrospiria bacterium]